MINEKPFNLITGNMNIHTLIKRIAIYISGLICYRWDRYYKLPRSLNPISHKFGFDRGLPIDRYYTEKFIRANANDIHGRVLEIGDDYYTKKFGTDLITKSDVLHVVDGNPQATIIADLTKADNIPSDTFDCIIFTQTLQMIYDTHSALKNLHRILKPGGVLLVTTHGICKVGRWEGEDDWGKYWHFTSQAIKKMFDTHFMTGNYKIEVYGNVLSAISYLHGLSSNELTINELDYSDREYEVLIAVRAVKPAV